MEITMLIELFVNCVLLGLVLLILISITTIVYVLCTPSEPNLGCHESEKYFKDPSLPNNGRVPFPSLSDPGTLSLTVVVPAYNEEERLSVMMDEAMSYLSSRQKQQPIFTYEVIVVDDGSLDKTTEEALKYSKKWGSDKVRVLTLEKNRCKGGAVRVGMLSGRGQRLMFADADGATRFSDVKKLEKELDKFSEDSLAVVCGSRAHLQEESIAQRSLLRTILMYGFHFLVWFLCVRGVRDTQCGFKMFTRPAARLLFGNMHVEKWAFDVDLLHIAQHFNIHVSEVPVTWTEIPGSKLSPLMASIQMFKDLFLIRLRYLTGSWKMTANPKLPSAAPAKS